MPQVTDELVALAESRVDSRGLRSVFGLGVDELELDWLGLRQPCWQVSHAPRQPRRCWRAAGALLAPTHLLGRGGGMWTPVPLLCILIKYFCAWLRIWRASERASTWAGYTVLHGATRCCIRGCVGTWMTVLVPTKASIFFQSRSYLWQQSR